MVIPAAALSLLASVALAAGELVGQALANGLELDVVVDGTKVSAGSTAMEVGRLSVTVPFFVKWDSSAKLVREAQVLRRSPAKSGSQRASRRASPVSLPSSIGHRSTPT